MDPRRNRRLANLENAQNITHHENILTSISDVFSMTSSSSIGIPQIDEQKLLQQVGTRNSLSLYKMELNPVIIVAICSITKKSAPTLK